MFDFRQKALFCLGYRLSKQKMTINSSHFGGMAPLPPPLATPMTPPQPIGLEQACTTYGLRELSQL